MQGKIARIWRAFGGERDNSRQKSRFRERKVASKPGMSPQTNLLKCMRSSWQFVNEGQKVYKRSVLRRQSRDTKLKYKKVLVVYCQYG